MKSIVFFFLVIIQLSYEDPKPCRTKQNGLTGGFLDVCSAPGAKPVEFTFEKPEKIEPIVFVPGLAGSGLDCQLTRPDPPYKYCEHGGEHELWVNIWEMIPYLSGPCFIYNMGIFYNETTDSLVNNKGVRVFPRDFGGTLGVEYLSNRVKDLSAYMKVTVDYFVQAGYERGISVRAATYDFRLGPDEWIERGIYEELKALVEDTYEINNKSKVHLAGHSLGGPFTTYFLSTQVSKEWKQKYIASYFSLAGSYDGGYESAPTMIYGKYSILPVDISSIIPYFGGVHWSIPYHNYLDDVWMVTDARNYTKRDMDDYFRDIGMPELSSMYRKVQKHDPTTAAPGVATHCFKGVGFQTPKTFYYDDLMKNKGKLYKIVDWFENGDCTVSPKSSGFCDNFANLQEEPVDVHEFKGVGFENKDYHRYFPTDKQVLDKMYELIYGDK